METDDIDYRLAELHAFARRWEAQYEKLRQCMSTCRWIRPIFVEIMERTGRRHTGVKQLDLLYSLAEAFAQVVDSFDHIDLQVPGFVLRTALEQARGRALHFIVLGQELLDSLQSGEPSAWESEDDGLDYEFNGIRGADIDAPVPRDWAETQQGIIADLGQALELAGPLYSETLPADPAEDYSEAGTAPARLLFGLGQLWTRAQFLVEATQDNSFDPLLVTWQRLESAVLSGDGHASNAAASAVHESLAELDRRLGEVWIDNFRQLPSLDYETRRSTAEEWLAWSETVQGVAIAVRKQARDLSYATSGGQTPAGWHQAGSRPSMSAMREKLSRRAGFFSSTDSN